MMFMPFFSEFHYKSICCGYPFELHRLVDAIQMGTHSICIYKEVAKQYTSCNPKSTELLDCALIGVCAVIRSNTVCNVPSNVPKQHRMRIGICRGLHQKADFLNFAVS